MKTDQPQRKYLTEYRQPGFTIDTAALEFELRPEKTTVRSRLRIRRQGVNSSEPLVLDGVDLGIIDLMIDDEYLDVAEYSYDGNQLTINGVPDNFEFCATVEIDPAANTRLEGLYMSNGVYCTQCEAEGFRHITFFIDRPDVMAVFETTVRADKAACPVLLSNGNKIDSGESGDGHWVKWSDPFPKPSYLFALVAGDLACVPGTFKTRSGRDIRLEFYTEFHNREKCDHALVSLQKAMKWDEDVFGLEYDLDLYMVVAVDDFNMGAMENKGLNVFNTKYVLANPETATDSDYHGIEGVIAHEYFHNWTGNRVTCRDWFQLSLKEGLTVFRDQEFSADMNSRAIQRIQDVRILRAHQFAEDAGPMAHPVRPSSYQEINNFYTVTVYDKGAEVVRMYQTLLGQQGFRKGMDLYFERHDGQAVTTDDFRLAMQDANDFDLELFQRWYDQAGTPRVQIRRQFDAGNGVLKLHVRQQPGSTRDEPNQPFLIPMRLAMFDLKGKPLPLDEQGTLEQVLAITEMEQVFEFRGLSQKPLISVFRGFSAPVYIETDLDMDERVTLMTSDNDEFNRWDAGQQIATDVILSLIKTRELSEGVMLKGLLDAIGELLGNDSVDPALLAEMLRLPAEKYLAELSRPVDVQCIHQSREFVLQRIAERFEDHLARLYRENHDAGPYQHDPVATGRRALKNECLAYLTRTGHRKWFDAAEKQFNDADNMTDQMGGLMAVVHFDNAWRRRMFKDFYERWNGIPLVVDKWFSAQASSHADDAIDAIMALEKHPAFNLKNPNRARSLLGAMQANSVVFHDPAGRGYEYLADKVIELDAINPQIAARLANAFLHWRKLIPELGDKMKMQVLRIQAQSGLSSDVSELMSACLADEET